MLDTAVRQIRYVAATLSGRRIRARDACGLVADMRATVAEFGELDIEKLRAVQRAGLDPQARRVVNARRWKRTVLAAYQHTAYYRAAIDRLGLRPEELTLDRIAELPPTPKDAVRACPEAFLSTAAEPVFQAWTTGTTGTPTSFWFSQYELDLAASLSAMAMLSTMDIDCQDVVQICVSSRAALGIYTTMQACRMIGAASFLTGQIDPEQTLARMLTPVHLPGKRPLVSVITVIASYLAELTATAERLGYRPDDFGLRQIVAAGEIVSDALRARAEAVFGAAVVDNYAMTETFPLSGNVCASNHLHVAADLGLVEVLDPNSMQPTRPGGVGLLVITPFVPYRETMPLLRLATGDLVRRLDGEPTCELAGLPATSRLLGRRGATTSGLALYQRDVLDLLEAQPELPLPCRYALAPAESGTHLHVLSTEDDPVLRGRLEGAAADRGLPIHKITLHTSPNTMPPTEFVRALLKETVVVREEGSGRWTLR
jgi:phenylacetate-CoA ligase